MTFEETYESHLVGLHINNEYSAYLELQEALNACLTVEALQAAILRIASNIPGLSKDMIGLDWNLVDWEQIAQVGRMKNER